ncbi:Uncharacterised protein [Mycobacterium tuberculosis]|uniref:Uncharacterized protein n=1 Tax=Mycobacterium tuberculosis TaxID=1773 RepID=A0A654TEL5_MYCTX|nr:Uncharacterised protein [Mycobacterium tuberculosis]CFR76899.1 Uncharacterised protein [Mycobacterium tuberculosis]CNV04529.1 Uncharacterised protein [Mycobacterium tuberculosis]
MAEFRKGYRGGVDRLLGGDQVVGFGRQPPRKFVASDRFVGPGIQEPQVVDHIGAAERASGTDLRCGNSGVCGCCVVVDPLGDLLVVTANLVPLCELRVAFRSRTGSYPGP